MRQSFSCAVMVLALLSLMGCQSLGRGSGSLYQVSTIDALLAGDYDGHTTVGALLQHGDFGIGTFEQVYGEMVVLNGVCYQVRADGSVHNVPPTTKTPFATVAWFSPDIGWSIDEPTSLTELQNQLDRQLPTGNWFYAIRVTGDFESVRCRSVPRQKPPYQPLAEVVKSQGEWTIEDQPGTLVGFRSPSYIAGVNVPGDHWHFLTDDRTAGGHVMDYTITAGRVEVAILRDVRLMLPASTTFQQLDLTTHRGQELDAVEMMPTRH